MLERPHDTPLLETIYTNDTIYRFLIYYFLEDLSEPNLIAELDNSPDKRWTLSQKMAAWLPYEKHLAEIIKKIESLRTAASIGTCEHEKDGC